MSTWWLLFALASPHPCALIKREPITAGDLAVWAPAFAELPADVALAPAPSPGARRVFRSTELAAIARSHALTLAAAEDLCFEWALEPLDRQRLLAAMQSALAVPDAHIEIASMSAAPAPPGRLEFRRADLVAAGRGNGSPVLWRGNVVYGSNRKFAIWARVLVTYPPADISRGDVVDVEVRSGAARLLLRARSEADGRAGETISLRNLSSNKLFQARVEGKGRARIETGATPED